MSDASIIEVSGGSSDPAVQRAGELAASYAETRGLAEAYELASSRMQDWARTGGSVLTNPGLLQSSILSPASFAAAETAVLAATTGPDGILVESIVWEADALLIRTVIELFEAKDQLARQSVELVDYALGRAIGTILPVVAVGASATVAILMSPAARPWAGPLAEELGDSGLDWLEAHPGLERHLFNGAGGVLDGLSTSLWPGPGGAPMLAPLHLTTQDVARDVASGLGDEAPASVKSLEIAEARLPHRVGDLVENLMAVNGTEDAPQPDGAITVQRITGGDGTTRWIVYAPGTDELLPHAGSDAVRDARADLRLMAGQETTYGDGLTRALHSAGIRAGEPVMIVGHSMGGIQALNLLNHHPELSITNVVTLGSPLAPGEVPGHTQVLSLENVGDIVPLISGEENQPRANHVTVRFDDSGRPSSEHGLDHYLRGAQLVDGSTEPGIVQQRNAMGPFFNGATTSAQSFVITR